jgi:AraC-like DNA-binding protein
MTWAGDFAFGESWAAYRGMAADNTLHAHAAIQVVLPKTGLAIVMAGDGQEHVGAAILIRPLVEHALSSRGEVTLLYAEPQSPLAFQLAKLGSDVDICVIDPIGLPSRLQEEDLQSWLERVAALVGRRPPIDPRLDRALAILAQEPGTSSISETAISCDLSESRLRTLAREQLGLPLSTWLIWRKLERAARAMAEGETLSIAAAAGGFADQAHLARAMRRMFGITPRTAQLSGLQSDSRSVQ